MSKSIPVISCFFNYTSHTSGPHLIITPAIQWLRLRHLFHLLCLFVFLLSGLFISVNRFTIYSVNASSFNPIFCSILNWSSCSHFIYPATTVILKRESYLLSLSRPILTTVIYLLVLEHINRSSPQSIR